MTRYPIISNRFAPPGPARCSAFTMVELVVVLVILGVLAFVAIPRLNLQSLQVVPVAERIAAEMRYAQNLALSRSESHSFYIDNGSGTFGITNGGGVLLSDGSSTGSLEGASASGLTNVTFAPRFGTPDSGGSVTLSSGGSSVVIEIESETGYVRVVD